MYIFVSGTLIPRFSDDLLEISHRANSNEFLVMQAQVTGIDCIYFSHRDKQSCLSILTKFILIYCSPLKVKSKFCMYRFVCFNHLTELVLRIIYGREEVILFTKTLSNNDLSYGFSSNDSWK